MKTECAEGVRGTGTEWQFTLRRRCEGCEDQAPARAPTEKAFVLAPFHTFWKH